MDDDDRRTFVQLLDDLDDLHDKADADAVMNSSIPCVVSG